MHYSVISRAELFAGSTATDNVSALALYRKFGFVVEGTLVDYAYRHGQYVDTYTMARLRAMPTAAAVVPADTARRTQRNVTKATRKRLQAGTK